MAKMERASYQLILAKYKARGKGNVRLTQSSILLSQAIDINTKTYNFPILQSDNQTPAAAEEIRLNLNDEFVSYEVAYYVNYKSQSEVTPNFKANNYLTFAPTGASAQNNVINSAWDSKMTIDINGVKRLENWDMLKHKCNPRTQFQDFTAGFPLSTTPSICMLNDGCVTMQPMITFTGAKKNEITISLNDNVKSIPVFTLQTKTEKIDYTASSLVLIFRGMLGQNAAKFQ